MHFASAYSQLQPSEREFVDGFLRSLDIEATKRFERVTTTLERIAATIDPDAFDSRTRDQFVKPIVQAAIRERVEDMARERDLTPDRIIREHAIIALANIGDYMKIYEDGTASPDLNNVPHGALAAIQTIEFEETYGRNGTKRTMKLKMYNKQASLDALAKWNGLDKGDNPEAIAYRSLPPELQKISANVSIEQLADKYAEFIDG